MIIEAECKSCKVSTYCPKKGSSPLIYQGKRFLCRVVGGYSSTPAPESKLSAESKKTCEANKGSCLTIVEIPRIEFDLLVYDIQKIFSPPVLMNRQHTSYQLDMLYARSHK